MDSLDISSQASERLTVLVADDAESDLLILSAILTRVGHKVIEAHDGYQAIELYQEYQPDIVILDVVMPTRDGFETAKIIKEMAGDEFVPIIFLTSLTDTTSLVKGLDAGGDDFLSKPYNLIVLNSKINALNRLRNLQKTVVQQKDVIQKHNERLLHEQAIAKIVFDKIAHIGGLEAENVRYFLSPLAILSLALSSTSWFFKAWIRNLFSLLFIQIIVAIVLVLLFSMDFSSSNLLFKFVYVGGIYVLIRANSFVKEFVGGISTTVAQSVNKLR